MVQRYLLPGGLIGPHEGGDWVGYEDYAALELRMLAAIAAMEEADKGGSYGLMSSYIREGIKLLKGDKE